MEEAGLPLSEETNVEQRNPNARETESNPRCETKRNEMREIKSNQIRNGERYEND